MLVPIAWFPTKYYLRVSVTSCLKGVQKVLYLFIFLGKHLFHADVC